MNLIEDYLKNSVITPELVAVNQQQQRSQEEKLEYFFKLFIELEKKYALKIEDVKRLELEHKAELGELEKFVQRVKELTEEREKLSIDFKDENDELKNKIRGLEREIEYLNDELDRNPGSKDLSRLKSDASSDDDLSESTIEMLILEGFGKIVGAPNHEKIATILADRAKILDELNHLKKDPSTKVQEQIVLVDKLEILEDEVRILRSTNENLSNQLQDIAMSKAKSSLATDNIEDDSSQSSSEEMALLQLEVAKFKEDNLQLKVEVEKLYDEIGQFEMEVKQLKTENKKMTKELEDLNIILIENKSNVDEIKKLKKEIDALNNELDDLVQYKANYDRLKNDYDKLSSSLKNHEKILNEKLTSPRKSSNNLASQASSSFGQLKDLQSTSDSKLNPLSPQSKSSSPQLELDWMRGQNEKLLLDLEKTETKLNDKIAQYNELKQQLTSKDDEMKAFISKYEKAQTTGDDLLQLQKKILELENELSQEKDEHQKEIDANEHRQTDLLKRNDQLFSQLTKFETKYSDALLVINEQNEQIQTLEAKLSETESKQESLKSELKVQELEKNELAAKLTKLESELEVSLDEIKELKICIDTLREDRRQENDSFENEINKLRDQISKLEQEKSKMEKLNLNLEQRIEALNKEKAFIVNQNEQQHKTVLSDYLGLQEKLTDLNYQINRLTSQNTELKSFSKESKTMLENYENDFNELSSKFKQEVDEKNDALNKAKHFENMLEKSNDKLNELSDKFHRVEIQKSKLEVKSNELETLENKFNQLTLELNEKRDILSQTLEKNGRLELQLGNAMQQMNEKKHQIASLEATINELIAYKSDSQGKHEEHIRTKHDLGVEISRREKAEAKIEEQKEEAKKQKLKLAKLQTDNNEIRNELIEAKSQLDNFKSKLNFISDKSHTEFEKNSALQDELNEAKKKLELTEIKCTSYSQKFDLLMKKYENRKIKQKNKVEKLWDYLQKERAKYKDLLANAQNDLNATKSQLERDTDLKQKQEMTYQQILDEKSKLTNSVSEKEAKIREMKRHNFQLQSKIKFLEQEVENLNEKVDASFKERNKLKKEVNANLIQNGGTNSIDILDITTATNPVSENSANFEKASQSSRAMSTDLFDKSFKSSSLNLSYWNELNASSSWDVNYNTGNIHKYVTRDRKLDFTTVQANGKRLNGGQNGYVGSIASDLNAIINTPRSYR